MKEYNSKHLLIMNNFKSGDWKLEEGMTSRLSDFYTANCLKMSVCKILFVQVNNVFPLKILSIIL